MKKIKLKDIKCKDCGKRISLKIYFWHVMRCNDCYIKLPSGEFDEEGDLIE